MNIPAPIIHSVFTAFAALLMTVISLGQALAGSPDAPAVIPNDDLTSRERLTTVRGLGLANSVNAEATGTSAVWHNPAAIADAVMYAVEGTYRFNNKSSSHGFQVNLLDMKSNDYVGAEISYIYEYSKPDGDPQHLNSVRLGLAVPLADRIVSIGVSADYSHIKHDGKQVLSQFTLDAGLLVHPIKSLSISCSMQNLIVGDYDYIMPRMIAAGLGFNSLELGLNLSFEASFNLSDRDIASSGSYGFGAEYVIKNMFPVRIGYRFEDRDNLHVIAAGLSYRDAQQRFGLDAAYQHQFAPQNNDLFQVGFSAYF